MSSVDSGGSARRHGDKKDNVVPESIDEIIATLARRSRELRDDLRFLLRAGDNEFVYFVELRGRGVFLRASPIDVSTIVRELLLDRLQTTVLTSAKDRPPVGPKKPRPRLFASTRGASATSA